MSPTRTARGIRVLVLSADVGEGHVAAARVLAADLRALGAEVVERDGLPVFGRILGHVIRDGYRWQLRWAPRSYDLMYWLVTHVRPARMAGAWVLSMVARRRLRRLVRGEAPDVVVSTHPALTCVLGHLRLRRRLAMPLCATITDLADYTFWSHPGADLHLVMHECAVAPVERLAGAGSAALVRPLVGATFRDRVDRAAARARLGLAGADAVVAVSGGGWGVGDLAGAVEAALAVQGTTVVALAARNDELQRALRARYGGDPRVRVWGFTDRMADLLAAADVAVHSTGGMTSLEALSCGCPLIAYGSSIGHIRVHNRTMAALGLITLAGSRAELTVALRDRLADRPAAPRALPRVAGADPAAAVVEIRPRVRGLPRWRIAVSRGFAALACAAAVAAGLSTDEAYSLAARPLELRPVTHVATTRPDVGLVVRASAARLVPLARALAARGIHASFAVPPRAASGVGPALRAIGDEPMPELASGGRVRWVATRAQLRATARVGGDRRYLVPPGGLGLGQYLLGRSMDASPVAGRESFDTTRPPVVRPARGDIVVFTADGSTSRAVASVRSLGAGGLHVVPLSTLLQGPSARAS
jgi:processive 1,2-diacylglycerol beta-glucosyltransferase